LPAGNDVKSKNTPNEIAVQEAITPEISTHDAPLQH